MWLGPGLAAIVVQCLIILCFHHLKQRNVPLHVPPSPVYPALHAHADDPTVLLQTALISQPWALEEHSSISENMNRNYS